MRKLAKMIIALVAVGSLLFAGTTAASAKDLKKPTNGSSVSSTDKAGKTKAHKATKHSKQGKKAKKNGTKAKKAKKSGKKGKRLANFAPIAEPTPADAPLCDPNVDVCEPTCDPMIDKQCQIVVDPTCDPSVDQWCEIVIDPSPTDAPSCDSNVDGCDPIIDPINPIDPIVDPVPTEEPTIDPTQNSAAWATYLDTVNKANDDYAAFINAAQADFDAATVDAKTARDKAFATATTFAEKVQAVKDYRLATADLMAQLQATFSDAQEAYAIIWRNAYDKLVADGGLMPFWCRGDDQNDDVKIDQLPPVSEQLGAPTEDNQPHRDRHHRDR